VRDAIVATVAASDVLAGPAIAARHRRRRARRQTVAVFGGGVAGLTTAHELAERGSTSPCTSGVRRGGKARSLDVPDSARGGRRSLPAEHGFREVFAGYQNLPDTMRRIPFASNPDGVYGNLVDAPVGFVLARDGGHAPFVLPGTPKGTAALTPSDGVNALVAALSWLSPTDLAQFVGRLVVFLSSGHARRYQEWEYQPWEEFVQGDKLTPEGRQAIVNFPTRFAAQTVAGKTSARTIGQAFESVYYLGLTGRSATRVLDAPTNEVWIGPWVSYLRKRGVKLKLGYRVVALPMRHGRIAHAVVHDPRRRSTTVNADWYVVALPVDWATKLWTKPILAADPQLARSFNITGGWMTGIQLYLHEETPIAAGPVACIDSPWAIAGISQAQFWKRDFSADYGDGTVRDKFSAVIVDWDTPGILFGKPARDCTREEIAAETWAQFKAHFTYAGAPRLPDSLLASTFLDPGIRWTGHTITGNDDPLPRCNPGTWYDRPNPASKIPNLFLASDYVKVDFDITSMEGANEAARRAVNALLNRASSTEPQVDAFDRLMPDEWAALRNLDDQRYRQRQPNILAGATTTLDQLDSLLGQTAKHVGIQ
jgi:uncharacterized protein with NAD-binding domain and iron-sulfur cluster